MMSRRLAAVALRTRTVSCPVAPIRLYHANTRDAKTFVDGAVVFIREFAPQLTIAAALGGSYWVLFGKQDYELERDYRHKEAKRSSEARHDDRIRAIDDEYREVRDLPPSADRTERLARLRNDRDEAAAKRSREGSNLIDLRSRRYSKELLAAVAPIGEELWPRAAHRGRSTQSFSAWLATLTTREMALLRADIARLDAAAAAAAATAAAADAAAAAGKK